MYKIQFTNNSAEVIQTIKQELYQNIGVGHTYLCNNSYMR